MKKIEALKKLTVEERMKKVEKEGIFLLDRNVGNRKVFLYYLDSIFCEVWMLEIYFNNEILVTDVKVFDNKLPDVLEPYLLNISLANLSRP